MDNYLKILDIFFGNRCNLACDQCDTRSDIIKNRDWDPNLDQIFRSIELAQRRFKIDTYSLMGGEPLLYLPKVKEIVKYIRQTDPQAWIVIPTNGTLIDKRLDELAAMMIDYKVNVSVCDHYAGFENKKMSQELVAAGERLANHLGMEKCDHSIFWNEFMKNRRNNPEQDTFFSQLSEVHVEAFGELDQQAYTNGEITLSIKAHKKFHSNHRWVEGRPKPFRSGDPEQSYKYGCSAPICSFLDGKKLYKCSALGTLRRFLQHHGSDQDPEWQPYLDYEPLDLQTATDQQVKEFSDNKFRHIKQCDMCPKTHDFVYDKTERFVLPLKRIRNA